MSARSTYSKGDGFGLIAGCLLLAFASTACRQEPVDWDALAATVTPDLVVSYRVPPKYPISALRRQRRGKVLLEATLSRTGKVVDPRIIASEPEGLFDRVAVKAFRQWRFRPKREGEPDYPQPVRVLIPFELKPKPRR